MPLIDRRVPWTQQPPEFAQLDTSRGERPFVSIVGNGLGYGFAESDEVLGLSASSAPLGVETGQDETGAGISLAGGSRYISLAGSAWLGQVEPFTLEVYASFTALPSLAGVFAGQIGGVSMGRALIAFGGANNRNIYFWGGNADLNSGVEWRVDGLPQHVFVVGVPGGTMTFYRDGAEIASGSCPTLVANTFSIDARVGDMGQGWNSTPTGLIYFANYHRRALDVAEIRDRSDNPWQLFAPQTRRIWVPGAVGGAYVADVTPTSYATTTVAPMAARSALADVSTASYAATFAQINANLALLASVSPASYSATYADVGASVERIASVSPATYAATFSSIDAAYTPLGAYVADISSFAYASTFSAHAANRAGLLSVTPASYATTFSSIEATKEAAPAAVANISPFSYATTFLPVAADYSGLASPFAGGFGAAELYKARRESEKEESARRTLRAKPKADQAKTPKPAASINQPAAQNELTIALGQSRPVAWTAEAGFWPQIEALPEQISVELIQAPQAELFAAPMASGQLIGVAEQTAAEEDEVLYVARQVARYLSGGKVGHVSIVL